MKRNQQISISNGNRKLGSVVNISMSPRTCCPVGVRCSKKRYALKAVRLYPHTWEAWSRNGRCQAPVCERFRARNSAARSAVQESRQQGRGRAGTASIRNLFSSAWDLGGQVRPSCIAAG